MCGIDCAIVPSVSDQLFKFSILYYCKCRFTTLEGNLQPQLKLGFQFNPRFYSISLMIIAMPEVGYVVAKQAIVRTLRWLRMPCVPFCTGDGKA